MGIDEIDLLIEQWNEHPPTNELTFAAWFTKKDAGKKLPTPADLEALGFQRSKKPRPKIQPITFNIPGFTKSA